MDSGRVVAVGTAAWFAVLAGLAGLRWAGVAWAVQRPTWLWTALAGALLGLAGLALIRRHRRLGRTR